METSAQNLSEEQNDSTAVIENNTSLEHLATFEKTFEQLTEEPKILATENNNTEPDTSDHLDIISGNYGGDKNEWIQTGAFLAKLHEDGKFYFDTDLKKEWPLTVGAGHHQSVNEKGKVTAMIYEAIGTDGIMAYTYSREIPKNEEGSLEKEKDETEKPETILPENLPEQFFGASGQRQENNFNGVVIDLSSRLAAVEFALAQTASTPPQLLAPTQAQQREEVSLKKTDELHGNKDEEELPAASLQTVPRIQSAAGVQSKQLLFTSVSSRASAAESRDPSAPLRMHSESVGMTQEGTSETWETAVESSRTSADQLVIESNKGLILEALTVGAGQEKNSAIPQLINSEKISTADDLSLEYRSNPIVNLKQDKSFEKNQKMIEKSSPDAFGEAGQRSTIKEALSLSLQRKHQESKITLASLAQLTQKTILRKTIKALAPFGTPRAESGYIIDSRKPDTHLSPLQPSSINHHKTTFNQSRQSSTGHMSQIFKPLSPAKSPENRYDGPIVPKNDSTILPLAIRAVQNRSTIIKSSSQLRQVKPVTKAPFPGSPITPEFFGGPQDIPATGSPQPGSTKPFANFSKATSITPKRLVKNSSENPDNGNMGGPFREPADNSAPPASSDSQHTTASRKASTNTTTNHQGVIRSPNFSGIIPKNPKNELGPPYTPTPQKVPQVRLASGAPSSPQRTVGLDQVSKTSIKSPNPQPSGSIDILRRLSQLAENHVRSTTTENQSRTEKISEIKSRTVNSAAFTDSGLKIRRIRELSNTANAQSSQLQQSDEENITALGATDNSLQLTA